jgi:hypothetical protein
MKKNNHQAPRERNYGMGSEKIVKSDYSRGQFTGNIRASKYK